MAPELFSRLGWIASQRHFRNAMRASVLDRVLDAFPGRSLVFRLHGVAPRLLSDPDDVLHPGRYPLQDRFVGAAHAASETSFRNQPIRRLGVPPRFLTPRAGTARSDAVPPRSGV